MWIFLELDTHHNEELFSALESALIFQPHVSDERHAALIDSWPSSAARVCTRDAGFVREPPRPPARTQTEPAFAYDAVASLALAFANVSDEADAPSARERHAHGSAVLAALRREHFFGATGHVSYEPSIFSSSLTRQKEKLSYALYNMQRLVRGSNGHRGNVGLVKVAVVSANTPEVSAITLCENRVSYVADITWPGGGTSARDAIAGAAVLGLTSAVPPPAAAVVTDAYIAFIVDLYHQGLISDSLRFSMWALAGFCIVISLCCGLWTVFYWRKPSVWASQPPFLILIVIGVIISISLIFPASIDHDFGMFHDHSMEGVYTPEFHPGLAVMCNLKLWLYCIGFVLTFGALLAKLWRIKVILVNPDLRERKVALTRPIFPHLAHATCSHLSHAMASSR